MNEAAARDADPRDFDVLVIGAGPAGIAASCAAAESGAHVGIVDDNPAPGGQIWRGLASASEPSSHPAPPGSAAKWHARLQRASAAGKLAKIFGATVISHPQSGTLIAESQTETFALHFQETNSRNWRARKIPSIPRMDIAWRDGRGRPASACEIRLVSSQRARSNRRQRTASPSRSRISEKIRRESFDNRGASAAHRACALSLPN